MALIKKISTEFQLLDKFLDTSGDAGTSGQVLSSTATGINWVSGGSLPGGPYLPLSAGSSYPLTNTLEFNFSGSAAHARNMIDLNGSDAHTFGTEAYYNTYGPNGWNTGVIGHKFYGNTSDVIAVLGVGGNPGGLTSYFTGKVGIGTDGPGRKLTVTGDASGDANNLLLSNENDTDGDSASIGFSMLSNNTYVKSGIFFKRTTTQGRGDLIFATNNEVNGNNVTLSDAKITIQPGGNVGIGTATPASAKLVVAGDLDVWSSTNTLLRSSHNGTYGSLQTFTSGAYGILALNPGGGNVGVGINVPQTKLAIGSAQGSGIDFLYDATNNYKHQIKNYWNSNADSRMDFNIGRTSGQTPETIMSVGYNGNVGINTTTPGSKLVVAGGTDTAYNDGTLKVVGTIALNAANNLNPSLNRWVLRPRAAGVEGSFDIYDARHSLSRLTIVNTGNVGVGDTAPTSISANTFSLSVNSSRNDLTGALISKANGSIKHQQYWDSSGYSFNLSANSGDFKWKVNNNERMTVNADGGLDIKGTVGQLFSVTNSLTGDLFSVSDISGVPIFNVNSSGVSYFDGNVLVGKTAVSNALVGVQLMTDGSINPTVSGDTVARFNRLSNDGEVIRIQKDTVTIGAIGTYNGVPWIGYQGGSGGGIMFNGASIEPTLLGSSRSSNTNDIGSTTYKWRYGYFGTAVNTHDLVATNSALISGPGSGTSNILTVNHGSGSHTGIGIKINSANSGHAIDLTGSVGNGYARLTSAYSNNPDFTISGTITAGEDVIAYSDIKLKENIKTLDGSKVYDMRGVSFTRKDTGKESSGVIAQEMQKVAPELVNEIDGTLGVSYGNLTGYLIEAIKDQQKQIDELKKIIKNGNNL